MNKAIAKYEVVETLDFQGVLKTGVMVPEFKWTGHKIDRSTWGSIVSFLVANYQKNAAEVNVRLYYNREHMTPWIFEVYPQKVSAGGTDDTLTDELLGPILAEGYESFGTVHSHNKMSAFQSGPDKQDENGSNGIHITLGNLDKDLLSCDMRWSFRGDFFKVALDEVFDLPDIPGDQPLNDEFHEFVFERVWCKKYPEYLTPERLAVHKERLARVTKMVSPTYSYPEVWGDQYSHLTELGYRGGVGPDQNTRVQTILAGTNTKKESVQSDADYWQKGELFEEFYTDFLLLLSQDKDDSEICKDLSAEDKRLLAQTYLVYLRVW